MSNTNESKDKDVKERVPDKKFLNYKRKKILSSRKLKKKEEKKMEQIQVQSSNFIEFDKEERSENQDTSVVKNESMKEPTILEPKGKSGKINFSL